MILKNHSMSDTINNKNCWAFLDLMIEQNASDMFLTYWEVPILRVSGILSREEKAEALDDWALTYITKELLVQKRHRETFEQQLNADFAVFFHNRRFRVNISKQQGHIMIVFRLFRESIPSLEEQGLPDTFHDLCKKTSGLIIFSWPTGSGKSTVLASMIEEINKKYKKHIISIEDPIEYVFSSKKSIIEQKELGMDIMSFADALKFTMRQNPDVILFWEMRDPKSLKNAVTLAETGHLVMTTIHSKSAAQTISKMIDFFPPEQQDQIRFQLSENLLAIINQRLITNKDLHSRSLVQEIMINNSAVANNIKKNDIKWLINSIMVGKKEGMISLEQALLNLIDEGKLNIEDALEYANDPKYIKNTLFGIQSE